MRRLLVTGGAGFIGANFVQHWLATHDDGHVVVLDALTYAGNLASLAPVLQDLRLTFVHGDILTEGLAAELLRAHQLDTIVHFAAESHVDRSIHRAGCLRLHQRHRDPSAAEGGATGVAGGAGGARPASLSPRLDRRGVRITRPGSTRGSARRPRMRRTRRTRPARRRRITWCVRIHHTFGLPVTTSNCSNNYGPYHFPEKLIPLLIVNILGGKPLPVYGDGRTCATGCTCVITPAPSRR